MEALNKKLVIENIAKVYDDNDGAPALHDVSFEAEAGEFISILGPSGCGKTTLLRILVGLLEPNGGRVLLDGRDITNAPASKRSMGIVFQNYALFENMTVRENICYAARIKKKREGELSKREIEATVGKRADELICELGLSDHQEKYPAELSGGQQQRVAIARTLILNPEIMLFDEPMSALDVATRLQLREVIKGIQREYGTTIIYITHDQEEAFAMSDRIIVMDNSQIIQIDTPEAIIKAPKNEFVKSFVVDNVRLKIDSLSRITESL